MFIDNSIKNQLISFFQLKGAHEIKDIHSISGGDINQTAGFSIRGNPYFIKWNNANTYPAMFESEVKGLELLRQSEFHIPEVIYQDSNNNFSFLVLKKINSATHNTYFFENFGKKLARMHQISQAQFGLKHNNYIGSIAQINNQKDNWADFFVCNRLEFQLKMARDSAKLSPADSHNFEQLFSRIESLFPKEAPSLLHGDLWKGNYISSEQGEVCLYDPAVYFGHREMDLGMSQLFGGFPIEFYQSYHNEFPLEKDWEKRLLLCNLYPLLVHLNIFGTAYLQQIKNNIRYFI